MRPMEIPNNLEFPFFVCRFALLTEKTLRNDDRRTEKYWMDCL